jgi:hypothetical protein
MNKPNFIEVKNSYERYCVYMALEQYATDWQTVWFNKSYKKEAKYATHNICKYCFRKKKHYHNVEEWEHEDMERDFCYYYYIRKISFENELKRSLIKKINTALNLLLQLNHLK